MQDEKVNELLENGWTLRFKSDDGCVVLHQINSINKAFGVSVYVTKDGDVRMYKDDE